MLSSRPPAASGPLAAANSLRRDDDEKDDSDSDDAALEEEFMELVREEEEKRAKRDQGPEAGEAVADRGKKLSLLRAPLPSPEKPSNDNKQIIASERVPALLDSVSDARLPRARRRKALLELAGLAASKRSYAAAAAEEGAAALAGVTAFLTAAAAAGDEEAMEAAAAVLAAAGGDAASGGGEVELFVSLRNSRPSPPPAEGDARGGRSPSAAPAPRLRRVPSRRRLSVSQASLGDGLGARLWAAAPALLAALDGTRPLPASSPRSAPGSAAPASPASPPPLRGATVLELGCGTGAGALACVALGAARVSMTDGERGVLEVAREGVARTLRRWAREEQQEQQQEEEREEERGAGERRRGVERGGDPPPPPPPSASRRSSRHRCCWDDPRGRLAIRRLWWGDGEKRSEKNSGRKRPGEEGGAGGETLPACQRRSGGDGGDDGGGGGEEEEEEDDHHHHDGERPRPPCPACAAAGPPHLDAAEDDFLHAFDVIVAADVLYDERSAPALAAEVAARLAREPSARWASAQRRRRPPPPPCSSSSSRPGEGAAARSPPRPAALLACPVRESRFLDTLLEEARARGLAASALRDDAALDAARHGVRGAGRAGDYEGGFCFIKMEWQR